MAEAGTSKSRVLSMNCYLADVARDYAAYNAVRKAWIDPTSKGTSATTQATLVKPSMLNPAYGGDFLVEIQATVAMP